MSGVDAGPLWVNDLDSVTIPAATPGEPAHSLIHRTEACQVMVQLVPVGGAIGAHHHTGLWDYFVGLRGSARIMLYGESGDAAGTSYPVARSGFLAIPPGTVHEVVCSSTDEPFVFLLVQAPYAAYDFVTKPGVERDGPAGAPRCSDATHPGGRP